MIRGFQDLPKENGEQQKQKDEMRPPKPDYFRGIHASAANPSPIQSWWFQEDAKRRKGLENEIDINEIKAAGKDVKNKWTDAIKRFPDAFQGITEDERIKYIWRDLLNIRDGIRSAPVEEFEPEPLWASDI